MQAYKALEERFRHLSALDGAASVLQWDSGTMMPDGGSAARGEQLAALATVRHRLLVDDELSDFLDEAEAGDAGGYDDWQQANLREMRRRWREANVLEEDLVAAISRAVNDCEMIWRKARVDNDFNAFAPKMTEVLGLVRQAAVAKGEALGCGPYDALLDEWEPGLNTGIVDQVFGELEAFLPNLLSEVIEAQASGPALEALEGPFDVEAQRKLGIACVEMLGFDFNHGRLDVAVHPFCGGVPDDVRITTRYNEDEFTHSLMAVLHETGHAQYERGLPADWRDQPVGLAQGAAVHESQSLLIENQVVRSDEFIGFILPQMKQAFGGSGSAWELDNVLRHLRQVKRSLIRVDADEVSYSLHLILRYGLEKALIGGDMEVADIPDAWNEEMQRLIGVTPGDDADGCLQDVHWSAGLFGYFPDYALGALCAAQFFEAVKEQVPGVMADVGEGKVERLYAWLRENIHTLGSRFTLIELLSQATGKSFDTGIYRRYLEGRYLPQ